MTCGMKPSRPCQASRPRSSSAARSASKRAQTIAWKHESQNHWNGYASGDGTLNVYVRPPLTAVCVLASSSSLRRGLE